jgi:methanogenic corrinoid protein MtbC1
VAEMIEQARDFERALLSVDRLAAKHVVEELSRTLPPIQILEKLVSPVLESIGAGWELGTVALSQVYMSGRICEELVDTLLPLGALDRKGQPRMAIAVLQDHHLLGKRIIYSVLRASGFELLDYGRVEVDELVQRVKRDGVEVLLISALMLPSALQVKEVRRKLNESYPEVKIVVGGAPFRFDDQLWRDVGADAVGRNSAEALEIVANMTGGAS